MPQSLWKWPGVQTRSRLVTPVPDSSSGADYNTTSSCRGGGDSNIGWSCPHLMLLSPDMQYAAQADNNSWAVYAVAGIGATHDCGSCYQLEITDGGSIPSPSKYIVQAVNTGGDVSSGQFDILMGGGGFGIYDACSSDCKKGRVCSGGQCNAPQFTGNFSVWTPDGNCYSGGVHLLEQCKNLTITNSLADTTLLYGCTTAIERRYHTNFGVKFARVQCPEYLYKVTGIRQNGDTAYPLPRPDMELQNQGRTTTTMDCCKPTCAWRQNLQGITDPMFPQVYTCDHEGLPN